MDIRNEVPFWERREVVPRTMTPVFYDWKTGVFYIVKEEITMKKKKSLNITLAIFIGLVLGILFGLFMPGRYEFALPVIQTISSLYMNALRMMIYPLVFCSLVIGIQGIGSVSATGKVDSIPAEEK